MELAHMRNPEEAIMVQESNSPGSSLCEPRGPEIIANGMNPESPPEEKAGISSQQKGGAGGKGGGGGGKKFFHNDRREIIEPRIVRPASA